MSQSADDGTVMTVQKAAAHAEIHGIGVYGFDKTLFGMEDVTSWIKFVDLLRREGPAGRVWDFLSPKVQNFVSDKNLVGKLTVPNMGGGDVLSMKAGIVVACRKLLARADFYTDKAFRDVPLDKNLKEMLALGEKRTYLQTVRMNRELMSTAFPNVIAPVPSNYHIIPVRVKAGKPVVLVLASYTACQWQVDGEVVGVVLCGTEPQEVTGVKAPIVYRAGRGPDGKDRWKGKQQVIWTSTDRKDESFEQLEAGVQKITGKTFTSFQGTHLAPKEGFVIKPLIK